MGWVGYLNNGTLFIKRFSYEEGKPYPDGGVNFETFTNEDMLECETLGPVVKLAPKKSVELTEQWELVADVQNFENELEIDRKVRSKVAGK